MKVDLRRNEICEICNTYRPCNAAFCLGGGLHWICTPCAKAEEARGRAVAMEVEMRYAQQAVRLEPGRFGQPFADPFGVHSCN